MVNKKLCASCVRDYEKELKRLNAEIQSLKYSNESYAAEIKILDEKSKSNTLSLMIIKHDPKYNRWKDISAKIKEESLELQNELYHVNYDGIVNEALDSITVCVGAINKCAELGIDIEFAVGQHQKKLIDRGWEVDKVVRFEVD